MKLAEDINMGNALHMKPSAMLSNLHACSFQPIGRQPNETHRPTQRFESRTGFGTVGFGFQVLLLRWPRDAAVVRAVCFMASSARDSTALWYSTGLQSLSTALPRFQCFGDGYW